MTRRKQKPQPAVGALPRSPSSEYEVGFGKPPAEHRFSPGRSGNPGGRPKGAGNKTAPFHEERLKAIVLAEAYRMISVNDGGQPVQMPMAEAVMRSLALGAAKGQHRSQRLFTELLAATERSNKAQQDKLLEVAIDYKMHWKDELARRKALRIVAPEPVPHPDDVIIDMRTGTVAYAGPITPEDKHLWDMLRYRQVECERAIRELNDMLEKEDDARVQSIIRDDIARESELLAKITAGIGGPRR